MRSASCFWPSLVAFTAALFCLDGGSRAEAAEDRKSRFTIEAAPEDSEVRREVERDLVHGVGVVEGFFRGAFPSRFQVRIAPDRSAFDRLLKERMGVPEPQRWMVASGASRDLVLLSPRVWKTDAVEHDGADSRHVREIILHELVHVYHAQHNPSRDFEGMDDLGWFVEGLAVYVSGQLERTHREAAARAREEGRLPARLAEAWSGRYRYGVCGSLVRFLDRKYGRKTLARLMRVVSPKQLFSEAKTSEAAMVNEWKRSLPAPKSSSGTSKAVRGLYSP